jgi:hypothetical protein
MKFGGGCMWLAMGSELVNRISVIAKGFVDDAWDMALVKTCDHASFSVALDLGADGDKVVSFVGDRMMHGIGTFGMVEVAVFSQQHP